MAKTKQSAADNPEKDTVDSTAIQPEQKTIRMKRDQSMHPGGPVEADVHVDEVANFEAHGWTVIE